MTTRSTVRRLLGAAVALVLLGGTASAPVSAQELPDFRIGTTQASSDTGLNPFTTVLESDYALMADRYDLLVEFGPDLQPAPGLAESWEVLDDGTRYVYHLREGVTWHDGTAFTAEDARFTLQYIFDSHDPDYVGPAAPDGNDLRGDGEDEGPDGAADDPLTLFDSYLDLDAGFEASRITAIETDGDHTLVIRTEQPLATLTQAYIPILPKHIWENVTFADAATFNPSIEQAIGTGPFKVTAFDPDTAIVLEANPDYWGGAPHVGRLIYQYFANDEAQVNALINGDVDFLDAFPATQAEVLRSAPNVTLNVARGKDFAQLGFNSWDPTPERFAAEGCADCAAGPTTGSMGDPWLTRPEIRGALVGLLDKQHLLEHAQSGFADPGVSIVSPLNPLYAYVPPADDPSTFPPYADEAGRAAARAAAEARFRDAMAGLGFADTDGNGILNVPADEAAMAFDPEGAGKDLSIRLYWRDDDPEDELAGGLIATWFEAAGVNVREEAVSQDKLYEVTYPLTSNADYDMFLWGWGPDPDPDFILSIFACDQINGWQDANYCDPAYDEMYREQRVQADPDARAAIVKAMQDKVYHEAPYAVLWYVNTLEAYRADRFEGFNPQPSTGGTLWSNYGLGPWGSRVSVGPIGAAGGTPPPIPAPGD